MLKVGDKAPDIRLHTDTGGDFRLSDLKGKRVVLYFYPRANTPGCTRGGLRVSRRHPGVCEERRGGGGRLARQAGGAGQFQSQVRFAVHAAGDEDRAAAQAYGVWKEKNMYGKKAMGIVRSTFVIGPEGKIETIYAKVKAKGHAAEVLAEL